jgi:acetyl-CoA carboxylase carboxyl transferase subunit alpha
MERDLEFEQPIAETLLALRKLKTQLGGPVEPDDRSKLESEQRDLEKNLGELKATIYANLTPWQVVQIARHPRRPVLNDYIGRLFTDFIELHGDRAFSDDRALIGGFATLDNHKVVVIGHSKGKSVEENVTRNFGMALPDGYRKALRLMKLAEKFGLPVVSFVDTPGAFPGIDAEERGQAEAIAHNLTAMASLEVPFVAVVTGEGGSGGALGIAVGDVVLMLQYAVYSVISPEGCASILWRDQAFKPQAADALKLTARSLLELGVIDEIVPEPLGGAHHDYERTCADVKSALLRHLGALEGLPPNDLKARRFEKYSKMGKFEHQQA